MVVAKYLSGAGINYLRSAVNGTISKLARKALDVLPESVAKSVNPGHRHPNDRHYTSPPRYEPAPQYAHIIILAPIFGGVLWIIYHLTNLNIKSDERLSPPTSNLSIYFVLALIVIYSIMLLFYFIGLNQAKKEYEKKKSRISR